MNRTCGSRESERFVKNRIRVKAELARSLHLFGGLFAAAALFYAWCLLPATGEPQRAETSAIGELWGVGIGRRGRVVLGTKRSSLCPTADDSRVMCDCRG